MTRGMRDFEMGIGRSGMPVRLNVSLSVHKFFFCFSSLIVLPQPIPTSHCKPVSYSSFLYFPFFSELLQVS